MEVSYDCNVCDYTGKTVKLHDDDKCVSIVNAESVKFSVTYSSKYKHITNNKYFQAVSNTELLIEESKLKLTGGENTLVNLSGCKVDTLAYYDIVTAYNIQVYSNKQFILLKPKVLVCELNAISAIWLTEAQHIQTLLINGIKVMFNYLYQIADNKVFEQYPIQPVKINITDAQLDLFPNLFLAYCIQIICADSTPSNSKRILENACATAELQLNIIENAIFSDKFNSINFYQAEQLNISANLPFNIRENSFISIKHKSQVCQVVEQAINSLVTEFEGQIQINVDTNSLDLTRPESAQRDTIEALELRESKVSVLKLNATTSISSVVVSGSTVEEMIMYTEQNKCSKFMDIFAGVNQIADLKKLVLDPGRFFSKRYSTKQSMEKFVIGEHTQCLEHLEISFYAILNLEILCKVQNYVLNNVVIGNFSYAFPDSFQGLTLKSDFYNYSQQQCKAMAPHDSFLLDCVPYCEGLVRLSLEEVLLSGEQSQRIFDTFCRQTFELISIVKVDQLIVPEHIFTEVQHSFSLIGNLTVIDTEKTELVEQSYHCQILHSFSLPKCMKRLNLFETEIYEPIADSASGHAESESVVGASGEANRMPGIVVLDRKSAALHSNEDPQTKHERMLETFIDKDLLSTALQSCEVLEELSISRYMVHNNVNFIQLYIVNTLKKISLDNIQISTLSVPVLLDIKYVKIVGVKIQKSCVSQFEQLIKMKSIQYLYINSIKVAKSASYDPEQLSHLNIDSFVLRAGLKYYLGLNIKMTYYYKDGRMFKQHQSSYDRQITWEDAIMYHVELVFPVRLKRFVQFKQLFFLVKHSSGVLNADQK